MTEQNIQNFEQYVRTVYKVVFIQLCICLFICFCLCLYFENTNDYRETICILTLFILPLPLIFSVISKDKIFNYHKFAIYFFTFLSLLIIIVLCHFLPRYDEYAYPLFASFLLQVFYIGFISNSFSFRSLRTLGKLFCFSTVFMYIVSFVFTYGFDDIEEYFYLFILNFMVIALTLSSTGYITSSFTNTNIFSDKIPHGVLLFYLSILYYITLTAILIVVFRFALIPFIDSDNADTFNTNMFNEKSSIPKDH